MSVRQLVRRLLLAAGLDVRIARASNEEFPRLVSMLREAGVKTVLDVGANRGQFASHLLDAGFSGEVISFEPIPQAHEDLETAARSWPNWRIAPRAAIGAANGSATFHVSRNTVSSSLREVTGASTQAAPDSEATHAIDVPVRTLDSFVAELDVEVRMAFLKIDTQGAEAEVLAGGEATLRGVAGLKIELSLMELYRGQASAPELDGLIREAGFRCWDLEPGFRDKHSGRLLQYDATYFRQ